MGETIGVLGLALLIVGVVAVTKGGIRRLRIGSRRQGLIVVTAGFLVTILGGAIAGPPPAERSVAPSSPKRSPGVKVARTKSPSPRPPQSPSPSPALTYSVFERKDVSYDFTKVGKGAARRLSLRVEIRQWPLKREEVTKLAGRLVERERGKGWNAIHIAMQYDRREAVPALGIFEWAPGGHWEDAENGDPKTWDGYAFNVRLNGKFEHPEDCHPPAEEAFSYEGELNAAIDAGADDEEKVIADIARRHNTTSERVRELIEAVELWALC